MTDKPKTSALQIYLIVERIRHGYFFAGKHIGFLHFRPGWPTRDAAIRGLERLLVDFAKGEA